MPASFTELALAGMIVVGGGGFLYSVAIYGDFGPLCRWMNSMAAGSCRGEVASPAQPLARQALPMPSGQVYLNASFVDSALGASVLRTFRGEGIQITDNPAQAAVTFEVTADVAARPGSAVGSTETYQAVAAASLKAFDAKSHATLLWTTFEGHGTATQADLARRYALDDAAKHLAAEYNTFVKVSGRQTKQEVTR